MAIRRHDGKKRVTWQIDYLDPPQYAKKELRAFTLDSREHSKGQA